MSTHTAIDIDFTLDMEIESDSTEQAEAAVTEEFSPSPTLQIPEKIKIKIKKPKLSDSAAESEVLSTKEADGIEHLPPSSDVQENIKPIKIKKAKRTRKTDPVNQAKPDTPPPTVEKAEPTVSISPTFDTTEKVKAIVGTEKQVRKAIKIAPLMAKVRRMTGRK